MSSYTSPEIVLYVGQTRNYPARQRQHASTAKWWDAIERIEWFAPTCSLDEMEKMMIRTLRPVHNVTHNR